jgi:arabinogalactan oligomer/maltooligosaccharide transport system substrate-binding protein
VLKVVATVPLNVRSVADPSLVPDPRSAATRSIERIKMRRITPMLALAAGVALFASACGGGDGGTDDGTAAPTAGETTGAPVRGDQELVIWTDAVKLDAIQAVADAFAEANGITVGVQAIVNTRADFITANAAGNGPDVLVGAHDWIGQLVTNGAIDPLQLSPDALSGYAPNSVAATTYDGQLWGLPYGVEALALYCNNEYAPDTYATLDDAIAAGQAAVDAGSVQSALNLPVGQNGDAYHMEPLFTSGGGYLFGKNADDSWNSADLGFGTPESIAAAGKIASLGEAGSNVLRRSIDGTNNIALFAEGSAACMISGPWALNDVRTGLGEDGYTIQPIPGFAGMEPAVPFMGAQAFYVASNGQNKAFAQEFVSNFVNSQEQMTTLYELANLPPSLTALRQSIAAANPDTEVFAAAADGAEPMPAFPFMDQVFTPAGQAWSAIVGGADPNITMTQTAQTIAAVVAGS